MVYVFILIYIYLTLVGNNCPSELYIMVGCHIIILTRETLEQLKTFFALKIRKIALMSVLHLVIFSNIIFSTIQCYEA